MYKIPELVQEYYDSLTDEEIEKKIKNLIKMYQKKAGISISDQIHELRLEAKKRNLKL